MSLTTQLGPIKKCLAQVDVFCTALLRYAGFERKELNVVENGLVPANDDDLRGRNLDLIGRPESVASCNRAVLQACIKPLYPLLRGAMSK